MPAEDLAWLLIPAAALILAAAFAWLTPSLAKLYPSPTGDLFQVWQAQVKPEPFEEVRSILTLAAPFILAAVVLALGTKAPSRRALDPALIAVQAAGVILLVVAVLRQPQTGPLLPPDYFPRYLLSVPNLIIGVALGLGMTAVLLRRTTWRLPDSLGDACRRIREWRLLAFALAIAVTVIWLLPAVNTDDTVSSAGPFAAGHISVHGEDYFAAVNGRTPLVDYISQYANLLPLLVEPVLRAAGPSITSLSISLCALSAIAMVAIYGAFMQVTRGAWSALALYVPWVALSLFPWHDVGSHREFNGIYYGVFPGRYFGPFVLALLCATWLRGRRPPIYVLFLFGGLVVLNNYEFGLGALIALIAVVLVGSNRTVPLPRRLGSLLLQGAAGLLTALGFVSAITLVRTGELPDPALLTFYSRLFLRDSFGLEPMSSFGLHWALYATYVAALLMAVIRHIRREPDLVLTGMLAFSGVFGLVTGMYFVGRSLQFQLVLLFPVWGFSLALVAWTAAHALRSAAPDRLRLRRLLIPASAALIGFSLMIATIDGFPPPLRQLDRIRDGGTPQNLAPTERVVEAWTQQGDDILLIATAPDHLVADRAGVVNVSPFNGFPGLLTPTEADRALDQLEDAGGDTVIERVSSLPPRGIAFGIPEFGSILRQRGYRLVAEYPALHLRVWRRAASYSGALRPPHPA
jgi:hypothetical protein